MLDAGGNPNARDAMGKPMIFDNWQTTYFERDRRVRFELLLDRGTEINCAIAEDRAFYPGYPLLLYRARMGGGRDAGAYADALHLLERGADFTRAAPDGTTLVQILQEHRAFRARESEVPPAEFEQLWQWLAARGAVPPGG